MAQSPGANKRHLRAEGGTGGDSRRRVKHAAPPPAPAGGQLPVWRKALTKKAVWKKEELKDAVFGYRLVLSVITGVMWGVFGVTGVVGILSYFVTSFASVSLYTNSFLGIPDDEEFGSKLELSQEGLFPGFAAHTLIWTAFHTFLYAS